MFSGKELEVTFEEACLIDWLITMHSFDLSRYEQLKEQQFIRLRQKIAAGIVQVDKATVHLSDEDIEYLFITCPITFRFEQVDVGFSLKQKLYSIFAPKPIVFNWLTSPEIKQDNKLEDKLDDVYDYHSRKNETKDTEQDSSNASETTISS